MGALSGECGGGGVLCWGPCRLWKESSGDEHLSSCRLSWATWSGLVYRGLWELVERDSGGGVSLSMVALWREPGGRAPLLGTLKDRQKRLRRRASISIEALLGKLLVGGSSTGDFERWMKGALGMEHSSLKRFSVEGLWEGLIYWGPWKIC